jgi:hypothetical protein
MGFKLISKALLVVLCAKSVISQPVKGKCAEAVDYFSNKTYDYDFAINQYDGTDIVMHCAEKNGKITELTLLADCLTEEDVNKVVSGNPIEKLSIYFDHYKDGANCKVLDHVPKSVSKLTTLKSLGINFSYEINNNDLLRIPSSVKELTLGPHRLNQKEIKTLVSLNNLESISFSSTSFADDVDYTPFESLKKLNSVNFEKSYNPGEVVRDVDVNNEFLRHVPNLKHLRVAHINVQGKTDLNREIEEIDVSPLTKLEELVIEECRLETVPESIKSLKNLKVLNLDNNQKLSKLPEFLCNFKNLSISTKNTDVEGKLKCPKKTTTTTTTKAKPTTTKTTTNVKPTTKISTDGRCGPEFGSCPSGYCCSKWGWCGVTDAHCSVSAGCLSEFGKCN